jgi:Domain of unknown function (DUF1707)/2TM domain
MDPALRIGDEERERTVTALQQHAAHGRIDADELDVRTEQALQARTQPELEAVVRDLPGEPPERPPEPRRRRGEVVAFRRHVGIFVVMSLFFVAIWALSGGGSFWPAWAILGWGVAIGVHAVKLLNADREDRGGGEPGRA